jgi:hypothetical protein
MSATRPLCRSRSPSLARVAVASPLLRPRPARLHSHQAATMSSRFRMVRSKHLAHWVALAEAALQHRLAATVETQDRPLRPAEPRLLALALLTTDPSVHLPRVVAHPQHPAALLRTVGTRPTLPATPPSLKNALVHSASSQVAVLAAALRLMVLSLTLVERTPFHSASCLRCAWSQWSPRSLSHSDQPTINILGNSAKVRHIDTSYHGHH